MKYRFVVTYRSHYHQWSVKVLFPECPGANEVPAYWEDDCDAMVEWCATTGLGRRMSYNEFMFDTEANATIFVLRFS